MCVCTDVCVHVCAQGYVPHAWVFLRVLVCVHVCACVPFKQTRRKGSKPALTQSLIQAHLLASGAHSPSAQNSAFSITGTRRLKTLCLQIKTVTFPAADNA